jgi:aspartyl/asparaginyl beta-hydroxylase (cupin superfamily)
MTTTSIVLCILALCALALWLIESRVFLYLWYKLVFFRTKNPPILHAGKKTDFPESELFENNWQLIREELMKYHMKQHIPKFHELDSCQKTISFDNGPAWRTILLKAHGAWFDQNCTAFPLTNNLLRQCKNVSTAMFSILEPGVQIPPHTGKFKGVLRYHLALQVPSKGHCFLRVGGEVYHWTEGEGVLFDDAYLHEVKNLSDEYRIVLFLDVKRKLPFLLKLPDFICHCLAIFSPKYIHAKKAGTIKLDL